MTTKHSSDSAVIVTTILMCIAVAAWWWQQRVIRTNEGHVKNESWRRVKEEYPLPQETLETPTLPKDTLEAVVKANPFSPKRRLVPPPKTDETENAIAGTHQPPAPQFTYKGRVNLGARQRAIVEDTANHKTYFLEVGQEVAGFKVLDIAENRVLLSNLQTNTEVVVSLASSAPLHDGAHLPSGQAAAQTGKTASP